MKGTISLDTANGMGAVLNKKMGVETGFKPSEWADTVNLMGKLPEATVSGAIANFKDGADGVPIKSLVANIPPTLDGTNNVTITHTGKNLFSDTMIIGLWSISNGTKYPASNSQYVCCNSKHDCLGNQEYSISFIYGDVQNKVAIHSVVFFDENETFISGLRTDNYNFTTPQNARFFTFNLICDLTISDISQAQLSNIQIEVGSVSTTYEPYTPPEVKTVDLGRTVYGGSVDVVTGAGKVIFVKHKLQTGEAEVYDSANGFRIPTASWGEGVMLSKTDSGGLCNVLPTVTDSSIQGVRFGLSNNNQIYMVQVSDFIGATKEDFNNYVTNNDVYVVYKLATETDFTFTPIAPTPETKLGTNTIWNDAGDSSVTYRRDIELALEGSGNAPLMMMNRTPVQNTESEVEDNGNDNS